MALLVTVYDFIPDWQDPQVSNPQEAVAPITTPVDLDALLTLEIDKVIIRAYLAESYGAEIKEFSV